MLQFVDKAHPMDEVMALMDPVIQGWFKSRFSDLTEPQAYAIPLISGGRNVLVSSPTGSGKTITAFLSIINELYLMQKRGELEDKIYCVYISPLKALANDIDKNLKEPLSEISDLARSLGEMMPGIRVAVRSGDTTNYERQKQARKPPHIFITTPESIALVLSTPKFSQNFRDVKWVIVDEIHEVSSSKRGVFMSISLERLQKYVEQEFVRIGLSATQAPIEEIARFLVGYSKGTNNHARGRRNGSKKKKEPDPDEGLRNCDIVVAKANKSLDLRVLCPVNDMSVLPYEVINWKMYDKLEALINKHRTTLIFTNTRSGTENVVFKLKEKGMAKIAAHHGSLSREVRLEVENNLRAGELNSVVTSTSLELGIDIGHIDLVVQIGSPKSVAKGIQRIGRSGHGVHETSKGRFLVFDNDDLVETAVLVRSAYDGRIDRIGILKNSLDVLAQSLVGMSLEGRWSVDEAYDLVTRSYCYRDLPRRDFKKVLDYLAGKYKSEEGGYGRIWHDPDENIFGSKRGTRMIYYLNLGTIPEEANYSVLGSRGPLGKLSEKFVERLGKGDIFVLGGKTYEFEKTRGMTLFVKDAQGRRPTVPSWSGEMLPRSFDLSVDIGRFRARLLERLDREETMEDLQVWLETEYHLDSGSARSIVKYFTEQIMASSIPTDRNLTIEGYLDAQGRYNLIFQYCFGRRTNDALSRAYAHAISEKFNVNVGISLTDDNFMLTVNKQISPKKIAGLLNTKNLLKHLKGAIKSTELFKQRFRHCAMRALMILRNYKGKDIPVSRQLRHVSKILDGFKGRRGDKSFPVYEEAFNEILHDAMDIEHATEVIEGIEKGKIRVEYNGFSDNPSPFAHNIVLIGASDIILMDDRSSLLRELQKKILGKLIAEMPESTLDPEAVKEYYRNKIPAIESKEDLLDVVGILGPMHVLRDKGDSIHRHSDIDHETLHRWATELIQEGELVSVPKSGEILWGIDARLPIYKTLYAKPTKAKKNGKIVTTLAKKDPTKKMSANLKNLEKAYLIGRSINEEGQNILVDREVEEKDYDEALRSEVRRHLGYRPPSTVEEIGFNLAIGDEVVKGVLEDMATEVAIIEFEGATKYMLARDKARLEDRKKRAFGEREIRHFLLKKHFHSCKDIDAFFERFYEVNLTWDAVNRVEKFDIDRWLELRESGEVLEGRFVKGRVGYVPEKDGALIACATDRPPLHKNDKEILKVVKEKPGIGFWEIVRELEDTSKTAIKESIDKLDRGLYLIRTMSERREWPSRNNYLVYEPEKPENTEDPAMELVLRSVKAYGPVTISLIRYHTGLPYDYLNQAIDILETGKLVERIQVVGGASIDMFMIPDEVEQLEAGRNAPRKKDRLRVLSQYDSYTRRIWIDVTKRYGEGWFFPIVLDGRLVGMIEMWNLSGAVEIREVNLDDPGLLVEFLKECDRILEYNELFGTEVLRIKNVFGKEIKDLPKKFLKIFKASGYRIVQNMLVKGKLVPDTFPMEKVLAYIFHKQHLADGTKYKDAYEAIKSMGGLHSEFEIDMRVRRFLPLRKYKDRLTTGLAIPEYLTYMTDRDIALYKSAKDRELDDIMKKALEILDSSGSLSRKELAERLNLDSETFNRVIKDLYSGLYILKDNRNLYYCTQPSAVPTEEARVRVMKRIVDNFGIISAEKLASYTKHEFKMSEIRSAFSKWEGEGWLVKGYLVEGDDTLYWIIADDLKKMNDFSFSKKMVLTPTDPIAQYLFEEIRNKFNIGTCYVVFDGSKMVGAFKATKRGGTLNYTQFMDEGGAAEIVKGFGRRWSLKITEKEDDAEEEDDWELMLWYEKRRAAGEKQ
jgi:ATP-dependent Lhr-like helicase